MCGILGIYRLEIDHEKDEAIKKGLRKLLIESQGRGQDATGLAYIHQKNNELKVYKMNKKAKGFVRTKKYKSFVENGLLDAKIIIGHTRAETRGDNRENVNNHPIYSKDSGLAVVHNGTINNYDTIQEIEKFELDGECDSEIILRLIERYGIEETVKILYGSFSFAMLNKDKPNELLVYKGVNPLHITYFPDLKIIVFSSDEDYIEDAFDIDTEEKRILNFFEYKEKTVEYYSACIGSDLLVTVSDNTITKDHITSSTDNKYRSFRYNSYYGGSTKSSWWDKNNKRGWESTSHTYRYSSKGKEISYNRDSTDDVEKSIESMFNEDNEKCTVPKDVCGLDYKCDQCKEQNSCLMMHIDLEEKEIVRKLLPYHCLHLQYSRWGNHTQFPKDPVTHRICLCSSECGFLTKCHGCSVGPRKECKKSTRLRKNRATILHRKIDKIIKDGMAFADTYSEDEEDDDSEWGSDPFKNSYSKDKNVKGFGSGCLVY